MARYRSVFVGRRVTPGAAVWRVEECGGFGMPNYSSAGFSVISTYTALVDFQKPR